MSNPQTTKDDAYDIHRFRQFIESITLVGGPYPDLNGHRIVADAYKVLRGECAIKEKDYDQQI